MRRQPLVFLLCIVIIIGIIFGLSFPGAGNYSHTIPGLIGIMLFINFLDVKVRFRRLYPKVLLMTLILSALVMPLFVYYLLSRGFEMSYRLGLLLIAGAPTGITTLVLSRYIKGCDYNLVFSNFLFSTFCALFYIPILFRLILHATAKLEIEPLTVAGQMALLVLLPYVVSQTIVRLFPEQWTNLLKKISKGLTLVLFFCTILFSVGSVADQLNWDLNFIWLSLAVVTIFLIHGGLGYVVGCFWVRSDLKNTLPFIWSSRNIQLVFAIAVLNFSPPTYVPIIMGVFFHHLTNALWIWVSGKKA